MGKISVLIVDPDEHSRKGLRVLIESDFPELEVVSEVADKEKIISSVKRWVPQLVFIDILHGGKAIFNILKQLKEANISLIFVTNHSEYALQGYQYNPLGFLLKPVKPQKLEEVIDRASELFARHPTLTYKPGTSSSESKITVADSKGLHVFHVHDIMYCLGERNYTTFKLHDGQSIVVSKTLKYFDEKLNYPTFFRAHKSNLINLNYVKMVTREDGGVVRMHDQKELPISRAKKKELYRKLEGIG